MPCVAASLTTNRSFANFLILVHINSSKAFHDCPTNAETCPFMFHLRGHWPELGRTADGPPFWRQVLARPGLAQAMACLDRVMAVP